MFKLPAMPKIPSGLEMLLNQAGIDPKAVQAGIIEGIGKIAQAMDNIDKRLTAIESAVTELKQHGRSNASESEPDSVGSRTGTGTSNAAV